jgi:hypothetical protein
MRLAVGTPIPAGGLTPTPRSCAQRTPPVKSRRDHGQAALVWRMAAPLPRQAVGSASHSRRSALRIAETFAEIAIGAGQRPSRAQRYNVATETPITRAASRGRVMPS